MAPHNKTDEHSDWNRHILSELQHLQALYGENSVEELAFLKRVGETFLRSDPRLPYSSHFLDTEIAENAIGIYRRHMAKLHDVADPKLPDHTDALTGWMWRARYSDRDMDAALRIQNTLLGHFATLTDQGDETWMKLTRPERLAQMDMVFRACEKIMLACGALKGCSEERLSQCRLNGRIVTDEGNQYIKPDKQRRLPLDPATYYNPANCAIGFGLYEDCDYLSDRREAYISMAHEGGHRTSAIWRRFINAKAVDNDLCSHGASLLQMFKANFEKASEKDETTYADNQTAYERIYHSQPEEVLAYACQDMVGQHYGLRNMTRQQLEFYILTLSDDSDFVPIVENARTYLAHLQTANENKGQVSPQWNSSSTSTRPPRFTS